MHKRPSAEIKDRILLLLKENPGITYAKLERKIDTGFRSVKAGAEELVKYGLVEVKKVERHPSNGRPAYLLSLTDQGHKSLRKILRENEKADNPGNL